MLEEDLMQEKAKDSNVIRKAEKIVGSVAPSTNEKYGTGSSESHQEIQGKYNLGDWVKDSYDSALNVDERYVKAGISKFISNSPSSEEKFGTGNSENGSSGEGLLREYELEHSRNAQEYREIVARQRMYEDKFGVAGKTLLTLADAGIGALSPVSIAEMGLSMMFPHTIAGKLLQPVLSLPARMVMFNKLNLENKLPIFYDEFYQKKLEPNFKYLQTPDRKIGDYDAEVMKNYEDDIQQESNYRRSPNSRYGGFQPYTANDWLDVGTNVLMGKAMGTAQGYVYKKVVPKILEMPEIKSRVEKVVSEYNMFKDWENEFKFEHGMKTDADKFLNKHFDKWTEDMLKNPDLPQAERERIEDLKFLKSNGRQIRMYVDTRTGYLYFDEANKLKKEVWGGYTDPEGNIHEDYNSVEYPQVKQIKMEKGGYLHVYGKAMDGSDFEIAFDTKMKPTTEWNTEAKPEPKSEPMQLDRKKFLSYVQTKNESRIDVAEGQGQEIIDTVNDGIIVDTGKLAEIQSQIDEGVIRDYAEDDDEKDLSDGFKIFFKTLEDFHKENQIENNHVIEFEDFTAWLDTVKLSSGLQLRIKKLVDEGYITKEKWDAVKDEVSDSKEKFKSLNTEIGHGVDYLQEDYFKEDFNFYPLSVKMSYLEAKDLGLETQDEITEHVKNNLSKYKTLYLFDTEKAEYIENFRDEIESRMSGLNLYNFSIYVSRELKDLEFDYTKIFTLDPFGNNSVSEAVDIIAKTNERLILATLKENLEEDLMLTDPIYREDVEMQDKVLEAETLKEYFEAVKNLIDEDELAFKIEREFRYALADVGRSYIDELMFKLRYNNDADFEPSAYHYWSDIMQRIMEKSVYNVDPYGIKKLIDVQYKDKSRNAKVFVKNNDGAFQLPSQSSKIPRSHIVEDTALNYEVDGKGSEDLKKVIKMSPHFHSASKEDEKFREYLNDMFKNEESFIPYSRTSDFEELTESRFSSFFDKGQEYFEESEFYENFIKLKNEHLYNDIASLRNEWESHATPELTGVVKQDGWLIFIKNNKVVFETEENELYETLYNMSGDEGIFDDRLEIFFRVGYNLKKNYESYPKISLSQYALRDIDEAFSGSGSKEKKSLSDKIKYDFKQIYGYQSPEYEIISFHESLSKDAKYLSMRKDFSEYKEELNYLDFNNTMNTKGKSGFFKGSTPYRIIETFEDWFKNGQTTPARMTLFRGFTLSGWNDESWFSGIVKNIEVGGIITNKTFTSFSYTPNISMHFGRNNDENKQSYYLSVEVPKGSHVLPFGSLYPTIENEVLLNVDSKILIKDIQEIMVKGKPYKILKGVLLDGDLADTHKEDVSMEYFKLDGGNQLYISAKLQDTEIEMEVDEMTKIYFKQLPYTSTLRKMPTFEQITKFMESLVEANPDIKIRLLETVKSGELTEDKYNKFVGNELIKKDSKVSIEYSSKIRNAYDSYMKEMKQLNVLDISSYSHYNREIRLAKRRTMTVFEKHMKVGYKVTEAVLNVTIEHLRNTNLNPELINNEPIFFHPRFLGASSKIFNQSYEKSMKTFYPLRTYIQKVIELAQSEVSKTRVLGFNIYNEDDLRYLRFFKGYLKTEDIETLKKSSVNFLKENNFEEKANILEQQKFDTLENYIKFLKGILSLDESLEIFIKKMENEFPHDQKVWFKSVSGIEEEIRNFYIDNPDKFTIFPDGLFTDIVFDNMFPKEMKLESVDTNKEVGRHSADDRAENYVMKKDGAEIIKQTLHGIDAHYKKTYRGGSLYPRGEEAWLNVFGNITGDLKKDFKNLKNSPYYEKFRKMDFIIKYGQKQDFGGLATTPTEGLVRRGNGYYLIDGSSVVEHFASLEDVFSDRRGLEILGDIAVLDEQDSLPLETIFQIRLSDYDYVLNDWIHQSLDLRTNKEHLEAIIDLRKRFSEDPDDVNVKAEMTFFDTSEKNIEELKRTINYKQRLVWEHEENLNGLRDEIGKIYSKNSQEYKVLKYHSAVAKNVELDLIYNFDFYKSQKYKEFNDTLTKGEEGFKYLKETLPHFVKAFKNPKFKNPDTFTVYRGFRTGAETVGSWFHDVIEKAQVGDVITNKTFTSFSYTPNMATYFADLSNQKNQSYFFSLEVPKGSQILPFSGIHATVENEVLMNYDSRMLVKEIEEIDYYGQKVKIIKAVLLDGELKGAEAIDPDKPYYKLDSGNQRYISKPFNEDLELEFELNNLIAKGELEFELDKIAEVYRELEPLSGAVSKISAGLIELQSMLSSGEIRLEDLESNYWKMVNKIKKDFSEESGKNYSEIEKLINDYELVTQILETMSKFPSDNFGSFDGMMYGKFIEVYQEANRKLTEAVRKDWDEKLKDYSPESFMNELDSVSTMKEKAKRVLQLVDLEKDTILSDNEMIKVGHALHYIKKNPVLGKFFEILRKNGMKFSVVNSKALKETGTLGFNYYDMDDKQNHLVINRPRLESPEVHVRYDLFKPYKTQVHSESVTAVIVHELGHAIDSYMSGANAGYRDRVDLLDSALDKLGVDRFEFYNDYHEIGSRFVSEYAFAGKDDETRKAEIFAELFEKAFNPQHVSYSDKEKNFLTDFRKAVITIVTEKYRDKLRENETKVAVDLKKDKLFITEVVKGYNVSKTEDYKISELEDKSLSSSVRVGKDNISKTLKAMNYTDSKMEWDEDAILKEIESRLENNQEFLALDNVENGAENDDPYIIGLLPLKNGKIALIDGGQIIEYHDNFSEILNVKNLSEDDSEFPLDSLDPDYDEFEAEMFNNKLENAEVLKKIFSYPSMDTLPKISLFQNMLYSADLDLQAFARQKNGKVTVTFGNAIAEVFGKDSKEYAIIQFHRKIAENRDKDFDKAFLNLINENYIELNKAIRNNDLDSLSDEIKSSIKKLDDWFKTDNSKTPEEFEVYRGFYENDENSDFNNMVRNMKVGDIISDNNFTSYSYTPNISTYFAHLDNPEQSYFLTLRLPKGSSVLPYGHVMPTQENEVLLPRNAKIKIESIEENVVFGENTVKIIEATLINEDYKISELGGNMAFGKKIGGKVYRYTGNNQVEVTDNKSGELLYTTTVDDWNGKDEPVIVKISYPDGTEKIPKAKQVYHHKYLFMDGNSLSSEEKEVYEKSVKRSEFINAEMQRLGIDKKSIGYEKKWLEIEKQFKNIDIDKLEKINELKLKLDELFLDEENYFEVTDKNIRDTIFLNNVNGKILGWTADNEWHNGKAWRGNDHNSLYSNFDGDRNNFYDIAREIAVIVPEEKMVYYGGNDFLIKKWIKKLGYDIESDFPEYEWKTDNDGSRYRVMKSKDDKGYKINMMQNPDLKLYEPDKIVNSQVEEDAKYMRENGIPFEKTSKGNLDKRLPAVYSALAKGKVPELSEVTRILDFGAGLGWEGQNRLRLDAGIKQVVIPYDKYVEEISDLKSIVKNLKEYNKRADKKIAIVSSNVLNVIPEKEIFGENKDKAYVEDAVKDLIDVAEKLDAKVIVTVYEGDKKGARVMGGKDGDRTFQSNQPLAYYEKFFDKTKGTVEVKGKYLVFTPTKKSSTEKHYTSDLPFKFELEKSLDNVNKLLQSGGKNSKGDEVRIVMMSADDYVRNFAEQRYAQWERKGQKPYYHIDKFIADTWKFRAEHTKKMEKYAEAMRRGDKFPLPYLRLGADLYVIQQGLHRIITANNLDIDEVPVVVHIKGSERHRVSAEDLEKYGFNKEFKANGFDETEDDFIIHKKQLNSNVDTVDIKREAPKVVMSGSQKLDYEAVYKNIKWLIDYRKKNSKTRILNLDYTSKSFLSPLMFGNLTAVKSVVKGIKKELFTTPVAQVLQDFDKRIASSIDYLEFRKAIQNNDYKAVFDGSEYLTPNFIEVFKNLFTEFIEYKAKEDGIEMPKDVMAIDTFYNKNEIETYLFDLKEGNLQAVPEEFLIKLQDSILDVNWLQDPKMLFDIWMAMAKTNRDKNNTPMHHSQVADTYFKSRQHYINIFEGNEKPFNQVLRNILNGAIHNRIHAPLLTHLETVVRAKFESVHALEFSGMDRELREALLKEIKEIKSKTESAIILELAPKHFEDEDDVKEVLSPKTGDAVVDAFNGMKQALNKPFFYLADRYIDYKLLSGFSGWKELPQNRYANDRGLHRMGLISTPQLVANSILGIPKDYIDMVRNAFRFNTDMERDIEQIKSQDERELARIVMDSLKRGRIDKELHSILNKFAVNVDRMTFSQSMSDVHRKFGAEIRAIKVIKNGIELKSELGTFKSKMKVLGWDEEMYKTVSGYAKKMSYTELKNLLWDGALPKNQLEDQIIRAYDMIRMNEAFEFDVFSLNTSMSIIQKMINKYKSFSIQSFLRFGREFMYKEEDGIFFDRMKNQFDGDYKKFAHEFGRAIGVTLALTGTALGTALALFGIKYMTGQALGGRDKAYTEATLEALIEGDSLGVVRSLIYNQLYSLTGVSILGMGTPWSAVLDAQDTYNLVRSNDGSIAQALSNATVTAVLPSFIDRAVSYNYRGKELPRQLQNVHADVNIEYRRTFEKREKKRIANSGGFPIVEFFKIVPEYIEDILIERPDLTDKITASYDSSVSQKEKVEMAKKIVQTTLVTERAKIVMSATDKQLEELGLSYKQQIQLLTPEQKKAFEMFIDYQKAEEMNSLLLLLELNDLSTEEQKTEFLKGVMLPHMFKQSGLK